MLSLIDPKRIIVGEERIQTHEYVQKISLSFIITTTIAILGYTKHLEQGKCVYYISK